MAKSDILSLRSGSYALLPTGDQDTPVRGVASQAESRIRAVSVVGSQRQDAFRMTSVASGPVDVEKPWGLEMLDQDFLDSPAMQGATICLIMMNAIIIGLETDFPEKFAWDIVENIFLVFFTIELAIRIYCLGVFKFFNFRNNPDIAWNLFDFMLVSMGVLSLGLHFVAGSTDILARNATLFRIIRLLRILRVLRIIRIVRFLKQLYLLAYGFIEGTMAVLWVTILASFMLYICAVILVRAYGRNTPEDDPYHDFFAAHFGSIPMTMFALFELITAPDLAPYREAMFANPPLVVFLVVFIILGSFGINGLLVALINESILEKNQARIEADRMDRETKRKTMQQRCGELFDELDVNNNRVLPRDEIKQCTDQIAELLESYGVNFQRPDLDQMFYVMDYSDTGIIERSEFIQGVVGLCDQIRPMSIMELHYQVSKTCGKVDLTELKVDGLAKTVEGYEAKIDSVESSLRRLTDHMPKPSEGQRANSRRTSHDLDTIQSVTFHQDAIPEWDGEGDADDIWSTQENGEPSDRSMEAKAQSPGSDCAGCNVAEDNVAANLVEAGKEAGHGLHAMLAGHSQLLTEVLEAVQAFRQQPADKPARTKASGLANAILQLQRANVDVLSALLDAGSEELMSEPEPASKKQQLDGPF
ncbi:Scn4a [Symbiodinium natans]|uniref:Scn4a protein n=1 Tax=Symbiodinium natans TaxID=878477 RepID=A0A812VA71_9DINO|nr:Scn4a [Symbiodinium natans]